MKKQAPIRSHTLHLDRLKDPSGRIDWLLANLIRETVERSANPMVRAAYAEFQPQIETLLTKHLGPKNKRASQIRQYVIAGQKILRARQIGGKA